MNCEQPQRMEQYGTMPSADAAVHGMGMHERLVHGRSGTVTEQLHSATQTPLASLALQKASLALAPFTFSPHAAGGSCPAEEDPT